MALPIPFCQHFADRLFERYGIALRAGEYEDLFIQIRDRRGLFLNRLDRSGSEIWRITHTRTDIEVDVVWSPRSRKIVTCAPPGTWVQVGGVWINQALGDAVPDALTSRLRFNLNRKRRKSQYV
ncbi:hypothetical protein F1645_16215 (plasmid) [Novacetimonas hansenii]|uniref:Uncharacterized protein n=1 Tax=Novacetimonas hansenii TaxID=436 RepID=A0ABQ0SFN5_NOVHA|nr:hypothetical protein [Novacetimonas hansenii]GAN83846.1 hypothetical protein Gaha_0105_081 [Novacetimonas hansenii JCM 7643]GBQ62897.1 hypothetical protein AA0243_2987 [Novacetimonas hansenii NRIC 0243]GEC64156.1 hypothetical protein GHA01_20050 [Novacetimonas hansenii]